jgi:hypothetical protein
MDIRIQNYIPYTDATLKYGSRLFYDKNTFHVPHISETEATDLFSCKSFADANGFLKVSSAKTGSLHLLTNDNDKYTEESVSKRHVLIWFRNG